MLKNNEAIIETQNLGKTVPVADGDLTILSSVNLTIDEGESIAIVGASGSGKSTLLGLLAGLDSPTSGSVTLAGTELTALDEDGRAEVRNKLVGFVFQSFQLMPRLTALENVMLPLELRGDKGAEHTAIALLKRVGLEERLHHTPMKLSGGEQQRVALARAFVTEPAILFADEPTGNLDSKTGDQIIELLFELNKEKPNALLLGGGVGIPPMVCLAEQIKNEETAMSPTVFMGSEVPFPFDRKTSNLPVNGIGSDVSDSLPLLEAWGVPSRLASLQGYSGVYEGYITDLARDWLSALSDVERSQVTIYSCGPTPMLKAVAALAKEFDLPCQVSLEEYMACAVGGCAGCVVKVTTDEGESMKRVCVDGPVFDATTVFA